MLGIIDLDTGNLGSLYSALNKLSLKFKICKNTYDFEKVEKIILPGVGAFGDLMNKIKKNKIDFKIKEKVALNVPILGLCAGYQILFSDSNEHGNHNGLNLIKGNIRNLKRFSNDIKIPHVGWNECNYIKQNNLFYDIKNNSDFYFTHSYALHEVDEKIILTYTNYDKKFISSVNYNNIYGVQFHPEKSQLNGLKLLKNFYERC